MGLGSASTHVERKSAAERVAAEDGRFRLVEDYVERRGKGVACAHRRDDGADVVAAPGRVDERHATKGARQAQRQ